MCVFVGCFYLADVNHDVVNGLGNSVPSLAGMLVDPPMSIVGEDQGIVHGVGLVGQVADDNALPTVCRFPDEILVPLLEDVHRVDQLDVELAGWSGIA